MKVPMTLLILMLPLAGCMSIDASRSTDSNAVVRRHFSSGSDSDATALASRHCHMFGKEAVLRSIESPSFLRTEYYNYSYSCLVNGHTSVASANSDDAQCKSYGAKEGSQDYINCRLKLHELRAVNQSRAHTGQATAERSAADIVGTQLLLDNAKKVLSPPRPQPARPPSTTTCNNVGGIFRCSTF